MEEEVKNILKFEGDEKLLKSYIDKSPLACLIFSAVWCPSCRRLSQNIVHLAEEYPEVIFVHIDAQASPALASRFNIVKIPTSKLCKVEDKNITEVAEVIGGSSARLKEKLNEILPRKNDQVDEPEPEQ